MRSSLILLIVGLGCALLGSSACMSRVESPAARVIQRFPANEATQAVAVDTQFFFAIDDASIGKYQKDTGRRVAGWEESAGGAVTDLNSGIDPADGCIRFTGAATKTWCRSCPASLGFDPKPDPSDVAPPPAA